MQFPLYLTFLEIVLAVAVAAALPLGLHRASVALSESGETDYRLTVGAFLGVGLWLTVTGGLASTGSLRSFVAFPPPLMQLMAASGAISLAVAFSPLGRRLADGLPLQVLIGFQSFRIAVEWMLHRLYQEGYIAEHLTFQGMNFDILVGFTAIPAAYAASKGRLSRKAAFVWNTAGLGFLLTIVTLAVLSMPTPIRVFMEEPALTIGAYFPFVWLPAVLVQGALIVHIVIYRKLRRERRQESEQPTQNL